MRLRVHVESRVPVVASVIVGVLAVGLLIWRFGSVLFKDQYHRFYVAGSVAALLTGVLLIWQYGTLLFKEHIWNPPELPSGTANEQTWRRRFKAAPWYWLGLVVLDGAVSSLAVGVPLFGGSAGGDNVISWAMTGAAVPFALRSPISPRQTVAGGTAVLRWYETIHGRLSCGLGGRVAGLRRDERDEILDAVTRLKWDYPALLGYIDPFLDQLQVHQPELAAEIRHQIYLAAGYEDEHQQIEHVILQVMRPDLHYVYQHVTTTEPTQADRRRGRTSLVAALKAVAEVESSMTAGSPVVVDLRTATRENDRSRQEDDTERAERSTLWERRQRHRRSDDDAEEHGDANQGNDSNLMERRQRRRRSDDDDPD